MTDEIVKPKMRKVRRQRCGDCAHLKSEHIKNSVCGDYYWETVMLPICIYCGKTCDYEEDEMCQTCWRSNGVKTHVQKIENIKRFGTRKAPNDKIQP